MSPWRNKFLFTIDLLVRVRILSILYLHITVPVLKYHSGPKLRTEKVNTFKMLGIKEIFHSFYLT